MWIIYIALALAFILESLDRNIPAESISNHSEYK
jgi:hypothetical protein